METFFFYFLKDHFNYSLETADITYLFIYLLFLNIF